MQGENFTRRWKKLGLRGIRDPGEKLAFKPTIRKFKILLGVKAIPIPDSFSLFFFFLTIIFVDEDKVKRRENGRERRSGEREGKIYG